MDNYKIYQEIFAPDQIVSVVITDNKEKNSLPVRIVDYDMEGYIPIDNLTKKKKIKSINKVAPMRKILPARVESLDGVVILTRLNISKDSEEYTQWENGMYASNKIRSLINYMKTNDITSDFVLENIVYPLQTDWTKEENLFDHMKNNYMRLELDDKVSTFLSKFMDKTNHVKKIEYKTKFGLVATDSVEEMINEITPIVQKYPKLSIVVDNYPYFLINSDSFNSKKEDHDNFIRDLNEIPDKKFMVKVC